MIDSIPDKSDDNHRRDMFLYLLFLVMIGVLIGLGGAAFSSSWDDTVAVSSRFIGYYDNCTIRELSVGHSRNYLMSCPDGTVVLK